MTSWVTRASGTRLPVERPTKLLPEWSLGSQLPGVVDQQSGSLIDLDLTVAPPPTATKERAASALQAAEAALKANPDDSTLGLHRRRLTYSLARARRPLTSSMRSSRSPRKTKAYQYRAIAHARLGHKGQARADLEKFEIGIDNESTKLYLAVVVAAELGEGTEQAFETLEADLKNPPQDFDLHYDAACAYALASRAVARTDQARGKSRGRASPQPAPQSDRERLRRLQAHAGGRRP